MNTLLSPTVKRYVLSSSITFLSTFLLILGTNLGALNGTTATFASLAALVMLAGRAAVKAALEAVVGGHADLPPVGTQDTPAATVI